MTFFIKKLFLAGIILVTLLLILACYAQISIRGLCEYRCFEASQIDEMPSKKVALVLGSGLKGNKFFESRMKAAALLYNKGKVEYLLISGDNGSNLYNELQDMEERLIEYGVPAIKIYKDYAGFRTLDSIVRAKKVFGLNDMIIVSQQFHNKRALYIADHNGFTDAIAFNADETDIPEKALRMVKIRDVLARAWVILDIHFWNKQPKYLGNPQTIP